MIAPTQADIGRRVRYAATWAMVAGEIPLTATLTEIPKPSEHAERYVRVNFDGDTKAVLVELRDLEWVT